MKTILPFLSACFALLTPVHSQENRVWTYAKTGSTCEGTLLWKSPDGTELQIKRNDNGRVITVKAEMLSEEDRKRINAWQAASPTSSPPEGPRLAAIQKKLETITIPQINFNEATLDDAIDFLRLRCAELDVAEVNPAKKGLNFVISQSPPSKPPRLNLRLQNVSLATALKSIAEQLGMQININEYFVGLRPLGVADPPEANPLSDSAAAAAIQKKLKTITIPRVDFEDTTIEEAIDFLRLRCAELNTDETVPSKRGVNFVITRPQQFNPPRIKALRVHNIPAGTLLSFIAYQVGMKVRIKEYFVELIPIEAADTPELKATMSEVAAAAANIIVQRTDFENPTLEEAVTFFNLRIKELAVGKDTPIIVLDATADKNAPIRELRVRTVSLLALVSYIASSTNHQVISRGNTLRITKK